jgi:sugar/nucleoside kinase (ribokinase family)
MLLKPVHLYIFEILREIPTDATMNQDEGVRTIARLVKEKGIAFSFDLSAATDRLPVDIQVILMNQFLPGGGSL